jgi:hypothetical protein
MFPFSRFTAFDMSMALTVPILCFSVTLGAVLVTLLLPRHAKTTMTNIGEGDKGLVGEVGT